MHAANEWLDAAARDLKAMHPDWTSDRPIRYPFSLSQFIIAIHVCQLELNGSMFLLFLIPAVQTLEAGTFRLKGQL